MKNSKIRIKNQNQTWVRIKNRKIRQNWFESFIRIKFWLESKLIRQITEWPLSDIASIPTGFAFTWLGLTSLDLYTNACCTGKCNDQWSSLTRLSELDSSTGLITKCRTTSYLFLWYVTAQVVSVTLINSRLPDWLGSSIAGSWMGRSSRTHWSDFRHVTKTTKRQKKEEEN
jgi:hypothetical protein